MSCLPCFKKKAEESPPEEEAPVAEGGVATTPPNPAEPFQKDDNNNNNNNTNTNTNTNNDNATPVDSNAKTYTFRELASATKNFKQETLLGEGGFGRVYKGTLQGGEVVAVKQMDRSGTQGNQEFIVEVSKLTVLKHPNLVNLIGYCADGDQRILVFEYMPKGCLEDHLHDLKDKKPMDWYGRMKIAAGAADGLEYLHEKANPPIIYRDLRSSNILLDSDFNPRLSDYGLAKLAGGGSTTNMSPMMMGYEGICAPEFERSGELTLKSDVYCFGIVLLELITGRKAVDTTKPADEQNLVAWAQPYFKDPKRFPEMADPLLEKKFPPRALNQVVGVAAMCLQDEPSVRPLIGDVVAALSFLTMPSPNDPIPTSPPASNEEKPSPENSENGDQRDSDDEDQGDSGSESDDEKGQSKKRSQKVRNSEEDDRASSDYGYGSASGSSEYEDTGDEQEAPTKSEKMSSRSRRKSKVKSRTRSTKSGSDS